MTNKFNLRLSTVLAEELGADSVDVSEIKQDLVNIATELLKNISDMETNIDNAKLQITHIIEELNSSLGREIRKMQPKMAISLRNGSCSCGYHSRDMVCRPDIERGIWNISGRLGNGFRRAHPEQLQLKSDMRPLAGAIIDYFKKYYRSL